MVEITQILEQTFKRMHILKMIELVGLCKENGTQFLKMEEWTVAASSSHFKMHVLFLRKSREKSGYNLSLYFHMFCTFFIQKRGYVQPLGSLSASEATRCPMPQISNVVRGVQIKISKSAVLQKGIDEENDFHKKFSEACEVYLYPVPFLEAGT